MARNEGISKYNDPIVYENKNLIYGFTKVGETRAYLGSVLVILAVHLVKSTMQIIHKNICRTNR